MASRVCRRLTSLRGQVLMVGQCHRSKCCAPIASAVRLKSSSNKEKDFSSLIQPLSVKPTNSSDDINVGAELTGHLKKGDCSVQWARVWGEPRPGLYLGPIPVLSRTRTNYSLISWQMPARTNVFRFNFFSEQSHILSLELVTNVILG